MVIAGYEFNYDDLDATSSLEARRNALGNMMNSGAMDPAMKDKLGN